MPGDVILVYIHKITAVSIMLAGHQSTRKKDVIERAGPTEVIFQVWKGKYFAVPDYPCLLDTIKQVRQPKIHEYIRKDQPVNLFFDIDFKHARLENENDRTNILTALHDKLSLFFSDFQTVRRIILSSHAPDKTSFHVIYKLYITDGALAMIVNKQWIQVNIYNKFKLQDLKDANGQSVIDPAVYNDGTLRTYLSCKDKRPFRPFQFDSLSQHQSELEGFIGYSSGGGHDALVGLLREGDATESVLTSNTTLEPEVDQALRDFVVEKFMVDRDGIYLTTTFGNNEPRPFRVDFKDKPCKIAQREHRSNTQFIVVGPLQARYLCHDVADCGQKVDEKIIVKFDEYTDAVKKSMTSPTAEVKAEFIETVKTFTGDVIETTEFDLATQLITATEGEMSKYYNVNCPGKHMATLNGYRLEKADMTIEFKKALETSPRVLSFLQVHHHYYGVQGETVYKVKIPADLFNNPRQSKQWELAINRCSEDILAQIFSCGEWDVVYSKASFFVFDGKLWESDDEGLKVMRMIRTKLNPLIERIEEALEVDVKALNAIQKTRRLIETQKGLTSILARTKDLLLNDEFSSKLNGNVRLIPFDNGVYDIEARTFRDYQREDMMSKNVGYPYYELVRKPEVWQMITDILPDEDIRDYFLKCCANALDGGVPNTIIVLMIGESASNGKSCLMGLMDHTFGYLSETVNPSVLTSKETNPAGPSPHLAKLQNARLVCMSEPERCGFNTSVLKRVFGGEKITSRLLRQNEVSFKVLAKGFIACNNLPTIDAMDAGVWRRLVCVPFTQRFVQSPTLPHEKRMDEMLSHNIDNDLEWRQSFMNILITYLGTNVDMPEAVKMKTKRAREQADEFVEWLSEAIVERPEGLLTLGELVQAYCNEDALKGPRITSKYKARAMAFLLNKFAIGEGNFKKRRNANGKPITCWEGIGIHEDYKR